MHIGRQIMNESEFLERMERQKQTLYRIAYGYLHSETLAIDAVDEAVYQGFIHRRQLKQPEYFETWLTRILIHECCRVLSKGKRITAVEHMPEASIPSGEDTSLLYLAVDSLKDSCKKVILLRYFGGYTISETAKILDIPEGTVATRTKKALELLRDGLNPSYKQPTEKEHRKGGTNHG